MNEPQGTEERGLSFFGIRTPVRVALPRIDRRAPQRGGESGPAPRHAVSGLFRATLLPAGYGSREVSSSFAAPIFGLPPFESPSSTAEYGPRGLLSYAAFSVALNPKV